VAYAGQVHGDDLTGACGRYPEFGRVRHFRLRGMRLTLAFSQVVADRKLGLLSTTLHFTAAPDPGAHAAQAERPGYLPPGPGCARVRKGDEARMCRNESLSWTECARIGR
jgi:hypothetical protein